VPLATTSNYLPTYPRLYYIAGQAVQALPVSSALGLYVGVNYKPTAIADLVGDASIIDYPANAHLVLVWQAAALLLLKGGTEAAAAANLKAMADDDRKSLLDDIRRMTINPTMMAYPDVKYDWSGG
jgi:NaMN:DMB phosphoribosyltransferase